MLMSAGLDLPKKVFGHGFLTKVLMSKRSILHCFIKTSLYGLLCLLDLPNNFHRCGGLEA